MRSPEMRRLILRKGSSVSEIDQLLVCLPYSQRLRLRRICSDQAEFLDKAQEMTSFFERRGYSAQTLKRDLENMKKLSQSDALSKSNSTDDKMSRVPLVLTYLL